MLSLKYSVRKTVVENEADGDHGPRRNAVVEVSWPSQRVVSTATQYIA
jgi:hypothetical protein